MRTRSWFGALVGLMGCSSESSNPEVDGPVMQGPMTPSTPDGAAPTPDAKAPEGRVAGDSAEPVECTVTPCAKELSTSCNLTNANFCALLDNGDVRCWGLDQRGALGRGTVSPNAAVATPPSQRVALPGKSARLTQGSCAIAEDGSLWCWGSNNHGQLGGGASDSQAHPTPSQIPLPGDVAFAETTDQGSCAVLASGALWCWGDAFPIDDTDAKPTAVEGIGPVTQVSANVALLNDGTVYSWGFGGGMRGDSSLSGDAWSGPQQVLGLAGASSVSNFGGVACVLAPPRLVCWRGRDEYTGPSTDWTEYARTEPSEMLVPELGNAKIQSLQPMSPIMSLQSIQCTRMTDGSVACLGDDYGPRLAAAGPASGYVVSISVCKRTVCALLRSGAVECWGANDEGLLGQGTSDFLRSHSPAPVQF